MPCDSTQKTLPGRPDLMFVLPMLGRSNRFFNAGYTVPKYQLQVQGTPVFSHAVRSFERYFDTDPFVFLVREDFDTPTFVEREVARLGIRLFEIRTCRYETRGQAETVYLGLRHI